MLVPHQQDNSRGGCHTFASTGKNNCHPLTNSCPLIDKAGKSRQPDETTDTIQPSILKAIDEIEASRGHQQWFIDVWCKVELPGGQQIRCWPQYWQNEGCQYDWAKIKFKFKSTEAEDALVYPGKVLALYKDLDGAFKALISTLQITRRRTKKRVHLEILDLWPTIALTLIVAENQHFTLSHLKT
jgi:hypothetical protein